MGLGTILPVCVGANKVLVLANAQFGIVRMELE